MSSGPTLTGKNCISATSRDYINFTLSRKDYCCHSGECLIDDVLNNRGMEICLLCQYRSKLDIPHLLEIQKRRKHEDYIRTPVPE